MHEDTDRTRTYTWTDPVEMAHQVRSASSQELDKFFTDVGMPPIGRTLDYRVTKMSGGEAIAEMTPSEIHYNPIGVVHGGVAATLIDTVTGCAVHSILPEGFAYTTLNTSVNYLRPMTKDTGPVRCVGKVVKPGRTVMLATAELRDAEDRLLATGESTCLLMPLPQA